MSSVDMEASWSSSASSTAIAAAGAGAPDDDIAGGVGFRSWSCRPEDANSENERVRFVLRYSLSRPALVSQFHSYILLCKKKILLHIKIPTHIWSTKYR
jgi:hypothetical protein